MKYEEILKVLDKYDIKTIDELEYCLEVFDSKDDCSDDPLEDEKNCINSNCYEDYFVPDCRKLIEVYKKYFQKDIKKKKLFIDYLDKHTAKSKSSIDNYLSCKSCNQQIGKGAKTSLKISDSEFKKDFCKNLTIKFDYNSLFETDYISIKQFLVKEHMITSETFTPIYEKEDTMRKDEEKKLFDIVHTSKEEFQKNLTNQNNLKGSDKYLFNLASYSFDRGLIDDTTMILNKLSKISKEYPKKVEFLQLQAKCYSAQGKDKEAIKILTELIDNTNTHIDVETNNLLAASIKREAFTQYDRYGDENKLIEKLNKARDIYHAVYMLNSDYYPALNYIYLNYIFAHINNEDKNYFDELKVKSISIWKNTNHEIKDWWSFISNIEFLILIGEYKEAKLQLNTHFKELDKDEITEFNISSTLRQLNLYQNFCDDKNLKDILEYLETLVTKI